MDKKVKCSICKKKLSIRNIEKHRKKEKILKELGVKCKDGMYYCSTPRCNYRGSIKGITRHKTCGLNYEIEISSDEDIIDDNEKKNGDDLNEQIQLQENLKNKITILEKEYEIQKNYIQKTQERINEYTKLLDILNNFVKKSQINTQTQNIDKDNDEFLHKYNK